MAAMFWKPGGDRPEDQQRDSNQTETTSFVFNANRNIPLSGQKQKLPIFNYRNHILYLVETNSACVIVGETGSGKSTQIPQYLVESNWAAGGKKILISEPRRNAVVTLATRVADEMSTYLGAAVGYHIRFEKVYSEKTQIVYMTDGVLLREIMKDPLLSQFSVVMVDEVHERNMNTDIVVSLLRKIQRQRSDLRVIIASATTQAEYFKKYFTAKVKGEGIKDLTCGILSVEGRTFPVTVNYAISPVPDYVKASVDTAVSLHENEAMGDILVFLTSQDEISEAVKLCRECIGKLIKPKQNARVFPYHGSLPFDDQLKVFETAQSRNLRRIIFSTNIAESSVTIPRIVYIIDCGFGRIKTVNPETGIEIIIKSQISQASAVQRAGRAGRMGQGQVYRLYTEESFKQMLPDTPPEITRANLSTLVLHLKAIGISNIVKFNFLTPPPASNLSKTLELMYSLKAIDDECNLTPLGFIMVEFPIDPMLTTCLLESEKYGCSEEMLIIVAMLQVKNVFVRPPGQNKSATRAQFKFAAKEGDHLTLLNVFKFFEDNNKSKSTCKEYFINHRVLTQADSIRQQLQKLLESNGKEIMSCRGDEAVIRKCLVSGMFSNAAYYHHSGVYKTFRDDFPLNIHPSSVLVSERPKCVLFSEVMSSSRNYMRDLTVIDSQWLLEVAPHYYVDKFVDE